MRLADVMKTLEDSGTEQYRKTYRRHGAPDPMFGTSWSVLRPLAKKIRRDQKLANELWATGNYDARCLACLIADPARIDGALAESWLAAVDNYPLCGQLGGVVAASAVARAKADEWRASPAEWRSAAGWLVVALLAGRDPGLDDAWCEDRLREIEETIGQARNRTRHEMNQALICVGARNARLQKLALAAAKRIGKVVVDHGETGCVTPDAGGYILKMAARGAKKQPAAARKKPAAAKKKPPKKKR